MDCLMQLFIPFAPLLSINALKLVSGLDGGKRMAACLIALPKAVHWKYRNSGKQERQTCRGYAGVDPGDASSWAEECLGRVAEDSAPGTKSQGNAEWP